MPKAIAVLRARQEQWARTAGKSVNAGCVLSLKENLFQSMNAETQRELESGAGNETGTAPHSTGRPKMTSLRSSSVLAVNFFDAMRDGDLHPLGRALDLDFAPTRLRYEEKRRHGLAGGIPPHLDVFLESDGGENVGIESKFAEIYDSAPTKHKVLKPGYFSHQQNRWEELGLPMCQRLADSLADEPSYQRLDAAQLLKHILGLAHHDPRPVGGVRLVYLWYDIPSAESEVHAREVVQFAQTVASELLFVPLTYQQLFAKLEDTLVKPHRDYLRARYFSDSSRA